MEHSIETIELLIAETQRRVEKLEARFVDRLIEQGATIPEVLARLDALHTQSAAFAAQQVADLAAVRRLAAVIPRQPTSGSEK